ncbi:MAG: hypothetical protein A2085_00565 [Gemmatimonadetes bacterium GWC2_71_10]|nr:MAG: hypothetical protein A2085_00565 [Gemmatimonadetes bacterium GWC2_71_10]
MGLFRSRKSRAGGDERKERQTTAGRPTNPDQPRKAKSGERWSLRRALRFVLWLVAGIAVMAGAGYLVVAVWLFPAPLLPSERVVPRVIGLGEREARRQIERLGLVATAVSEPHPTAAAGLVTWQDPPPGVAAPRDTRVRVTVSSGLPRARVPEVRGMDLAMVERMLAAVGLRIETIDTVAVKGRTPGSATGTTPAAGDSLQIGRGVIVHLAR